MESPKEIITQAGLEYVGIQETKTGSGHLFNAPTGSTLMLTGEVTPETIRAKLAEHQEKWQRAKEAA